jgi:transcriptional repressor NrdR
VGKAILGPLRRLDEVAYLRFASVYRSFASADDFEEEIALLRAARQEPAARAVVEQRAPASVVETPAPASEPHLASAPSG